MEDLVCFFGFDSSLPSPGPRLSASEIERHIKHVLDKQSTLQTRMEQLESRLQFLKSLHQNAVHTEQSIQWEKESPVAQDVGDPVKQPAASRDSTEAGASAALFDRSGSASNTVGKPVVALNADDEAMPETLVDLPRVPPVPDSDSDYIFLVVCPLPRLDFFFTTKKGFVERGAKNSSVIRMNGVDPASPPAGFTDEMCSRASMLWHYFRLRFLPEARRLFRTQAGLHVVFWVEDDCQLEDNVSVPDLVQLCRHSKTMPVWLGWTRAVRGVPWWGAHLIGFTQLAVEATVAWAETYSGRRRGLDTILNEFAEGYQGLPPALSFAARSLARQRRHHLVGRRMPADL